MADETPKPPPEKPPPEAYDLEPVNPQPPPGPPPKLGREGLIDDFDEDADFDKDPEVDKALGKAPPPAAAAEPAPPRELLVVEGRGPVEQLALAGGIIAILAVAIASATTQSGRVYVGVGNLFFTVVHVLTGMAALAVAAHLQECRFGAWKTGAARMLLAVSVFQLINGVTLSSMGAWQRLFIIPAAAGAYFLALWALFGWKRERVIVVAACHAVLAIAIWLLLAAHALIESGLTKAASAAPGTGS